MATNITPTSVLINPIPHALQAVVEVPGSKSITNRALLLAALAGGTSRLVNALDSDDSRFFMKALQDLGFSIIHEPENSEIKVKGLGGAILPTEACLYIGNAGTAARFLTAFLTLGYGHFILDGDQRMRNRPIGDLMHSLNQLGAKITPQNQQLKPACPPLEIHASGLRGGKTTIAGDISSQFLSALLIVAPYAAASVEIELTTSLTSKPYIDMTIAVMSDFGVEISQHDYEIFQIVPGFYLPKDVYKIESDASAASYFFAAPAICGGSVKVKDISRNSCQGDIRFLEVLEKMGCVVEENNLEVTVSASAGLRGVDVDMGDFSDTAQTLAAVAPFASTPTCIRGIASSRLKETDRISAVCAELRKIGVRVDEHADGMTIFPCQNINGTSIQTYQDHRMAMAFSLIGLRVPGMKIENPGCVSKTFPNYFNVLEGLR